MKINTKYWGKIEIDKINKIYFTDGLLGFETLKEFILLDVPENDDFKCLQSVKEIDIAFLITEPWKIIKDYDLDIDDDELKEIGIKKIEQVKIYNIVTIPKDYKKMSVNLLAPIIINLDHLKANQIVLYNSNYTTKHYLYNEVNSDASIG